MKLTKDVLMNQPSEEIVKKVVKAAKEIGATHVALAIPLNKTEEYSGTPSPLTVEEYTSLWANEIHLAGLNILWRGTFCEVEGIYSFQKAVGSNRKPMNYYWDAAYNYIKDNPTFFSGGDLWAILPERTENIWSDDTSFIWHGDSGIQDNYVNFFKELHDRSKQAFNEIGVDVVVNMTANNWTEVDSGWIHQSYFDNSGVVAFDHYGRDHMVTSLIDDYQSTFNKKNEIPMFHQEWADYWNEGNGQERLSYLEEVLSVVNNYAIEGKLIGFNYWGFWPETGQAGSDEGILDSDYKLNLRGLLLKAWWAEQEPEPDPDEEPEEEQQEVGHFLDDAFDDVITEDEIYLDFITITNRSSGEIILSDKDGVELTRFRRYAPENSYRFEHVFNGLRIRKTKTGRIYIKYIK